MTIPNLSIIIPVFNGWEQTQRCLRDLEPSTPDIAVIVVDHGSTDATKTELPLQFPYVEHLLQSEDLWWTGATNAGIRYALEEGTNFIMLLNNDCVLSRKSVEQLMGLARGSESIVAPVQVSLDTGDIICVSATPLVSFGFPNFHVRRRLVSSPKTSLRRARMLCGGRGVVIPSSVLERVGLLAEAELPHYGADHDFYLRCRSAGIPLLVATDVTVQVDESRTSVASGLAAMTWTDFRDSLRNPRSHRNLPALRAFFRRHYPVRSLWWIGLGLNLARYTVRWGLVRAFAKLGVGTSRFGRKR